MGKIHPDARQVAHIYMNEMTVFDKTSMLWTAEMTKQELSRWYKPIMAIFVIIYCIKSMNGFFISSLIWFQRTSNGYIILISW